MPLESAMHTARADVAVVALVAFTSTRYAEAPREVLEMFWLQEVFLVREGIPYQIQSTVIGLEKIYLKMFFS